MMGMPQDENEEIGNGFAVVIVTLFTVLCGAVGCLSLLAWMVFA
jgi:nitrate reductase NapE component